MAHETDGSVEALEVEVVLEGDRQAVERADGLPRAGKMLVARAGCLQRPGEACLREAV